MSNYLKVAQALAIYASEGVVKALPLLTQAGWSFEEALEIFVVYDDPKSVSIAD